MWKMSINIDFLYVEGVNNLNGLRSHHPVIFKPRKTAHCSAKFHTFKTVHYLSNGKINERVISSGVWQRVVRWKSSDISEEDIASVFII
jgi:hypothetical protein